MKFINYLKIIYFDILFSEDSSNKANDQNTLLQRSGDINQLLKSKNAEYVKNILQKEYEKFCHTLDFIMERKKEFNALLSNSKLHAYSLKKAKVPKRIRKAHSENLKMKENFRVFSFRSSKLESSNYSLSKKSKSNKNINTISIYERENSLKDDTSEDIGSVSKDFSHSQIGGDMICSFHESPKPRLSNKFIKPIKLNSEKDIKLVKVYTAYDYTRNITDELLEKQPSIESVKTPNFKPSIVSNAIRNTEMTDGRKFNFSDNRKGNSQNLNNSEIIFLSETQELDFKEKLHSLNTQDQANSSAEEENKDYNKYGHTTDNLHFFSFKVNSMLSIHDQTINNFHFKDDNLKETKDFDCEKDDYDMLFLTKNVENTLIQSPVDNPFQANKEENIKNEAISMSNIMRSRQQSDATGLNETTDINNFRSDDFDQAFKSECQKSHNQMIFQNETSDNIKYQELAEDRSLVHISASNILSTQILNSSEKNIVIMSNSASFGEEQIKEDKKGECESPSLYSKLNKEDNPLADDSMQAAAEKFLIDESACHAAKDDKSCEASKLNDKKKVRGFNFRNNISEKLKKQGMGGKFQDDHNPTTLTARVPNNKESNENISVVTSNKPVSERISNKLMINENSNCSTLKKKDADQIASSLNNSNDQQSPLQDSNQKSDQQTSVNASIVSDSAQSSNPNIKKVAKPKKFNFHNKPKKESEP